MTNPWRTLGLAACGLVFACGGPQAGQAVSPTPSPQPEVEAPSEIEAPPPQPVADPDPFPVGAIADLRFNPTLLSTRGLVHVQFRGTEPLARLGGASTTVVAILTGTDGLTIKSNDVHPKPDARTGLLLYDQWRFQFETPLPIGRYTIHVESPQGNLHSRPKAVYVVPQGGCVADEKAEASCELRGKDFRYGPMMSYYCGGQAPIKRPEAGLEACACNNLPSYHEQRRRCQSQPPRPSKPRR